MWDERAKAAIDRSRNGSTGSAIMAQLLAAANRKGPVPHRYPVVLQIRLLEQAREFWGHEPSQLSPESTSYQPPRDVLGAFWSQGRGSLSGGKRHKTPEVASLG